MLMRERDRAVDQVMDAVMTAIRRRVGHTLHALQGRWSAVAFERTGDAAHAARLFAAPGGSTL
jgi:hypothetical protein